MTKTQAGAKIRRKWLEMVNRKTENCDPDNAWCELCKRKYDGREVKGMSQAHRMKRRKMPDWKRYPDEWEAEMMVAAYLCGDCHLELEHGDPEIMYDTITEIHENR